MLQSPRRPAQTIAAAAVLLPLILLPLAYRSSAAKTSAQAPATLAKTASIADSPARLSAAPAVAAVTGLVMTLAAKRDCWIRTGVDGGQPLERLLKAGEAIIVRANEEAILRVGDASAIMLLVNNRMARPLGKSGEVVTARITPFNYLNLMADETTP